MPWRMAVQQGPSKRQRQAMPSGMTVERRPSRYRKRRVRGGRRSNKPRCEGIGGLGCRIGSRQAACLLQHPHQCSFFACKLFFGKHTLCAQFAKLLERLQDILRLHTKSLHDAQKIEKGGALGGRREWFGRRADTKKRHTIYADTMVRCGEVRKVLAFRNATSGQRRCDRLDQNHTRLEAQAPSHEWACKTQRHGQRCDLRQIRGAPLH